VVLADIENIFFLNDDFILFLYCLKDNIWVYCLVMCHRLFDDSVSKVNIVQCWLWWLVKQRKMLSLVQSKKQETLGLSSRNTSAYHGMTFSSDSSDPCSMDGVLKDRILAVFLPLLTLGISSMSSNLTAVSFHVSCHYRAIKIISGFRVRVSITILSRVTVTSTRVWIGIWIY
jgi:hypothetical protein